MDEIDKKIIKARIQLLENFPFFGYLGMYLKIHRDSDQKIVKPETPMAVNNFGDVYYLPEFVEKLDIEQVKATLAHEILHVVLEHADRLRDRNPILWNIAGDMKVNQIVDDNKLRLPNPHITIRDEWKNLIEEQIYDKLPKPKGGGSGEGRSGGYGNEDGKGFDKVFKGKGEGNKEAPSKQKLKENKDFWKNKTAEASAFSQQKGSKPAGLEKLLEWILGRKQLNWRNILLRFIEQMIQADYTYTKPSKKSWSSNVFIPSVKKENMKIWISIDSSGSISDKQYEEFVSESFSIMNSFDNIEVKFFVCDADIQKEVTGMDKYDIIREIQRRRGYGGTDFRPVFEKAEEDNASILIFFSDLYGEFPKEETIKTIWVRSKSDVEPPFGLVIDLEQGGDDNGK